jgi:hypothetical protein
VHGAAEAAGAALALAVHLGHHGVDRRALRDRVRVRAMRRRDDVARLERCADAARHRLLADRDVEEAGQLSRAEALLDLLLEATDHEHLPQQVVQALIVQRRSRGTRLSLHLGHGRHYADAP